MSRFKRVLSFILTMVMLVGMIPSLGITVDAAVAYDTVPSVHSNDDGETKDRELKRLAVFNIDLKDGVYYYTNFGKGDYRVKQENLLIPDGTTGTIQVRVYHSMYSRGVSGRPTAVTYGDYIGIPYVNNVMMANDDLNLRDLLVTLFYSLYKVTDNNGIKTVSQLNSFDWGSGNAINQAFVNPHNFIDGTLNPGTLFGTSDDYETWKMPCVWETPTASDGKAVTLTAGPEGNGQSVDVVLLDHSRDELDYILPINEKVIKELYGFYTERGASDERVFIGWAEGYDEVSHQGIGTLYNRFNLQYDGDSSVLHAIWGYPIMFNTDDAVIKDAGGYLYDNGLSAKDNDEYLAYVADYAEWMADGTTDPASVYGYVIPDLNGYTVTKEGARRFEGRDDYALIKADGKQFFTWEGAIQNLTIPPTGGAHYPSGNVNTAEWSGFRLTDADDSNNPYGIAFPEFVAIWEPSVTYYANAPEGEYTGTMPTDWLDWGYERLYCYEDYIIRGCTFSKENATFTGWNTKPDGTGYSYEPGKVINQLSSSDPIVLYAQWSDNSYTPTGNYTVTLDPFGGSLGSVEGSNGKVEGGKLICPAELEQTYGEIIGTLPTPTRNGYEFDGWWYKQSDVVYAKDVVGGATAGHIHHFKNSRGEEYYAYGEGWFLDLDTKYVIPQSVTFEAKWVEKSNVSKANSSGRTMTFNPNGGTMITQSTFQISKNNTYRSAMGGNNAVPMAVRRGYTLEGWYWYQVNSKNNATPPAAVLNPDMTFEDAINHYDDSWDVSSITYVFKLSIDEKFSIDSNFSFYANWVKIPHECEWVNISVKRATCIEDGDTYQGCVCGATRHVTEPKKPHSYTIPWGVETQATCTEPRVDIYLCDICKEATTTVETGETLGGHIWAEEWKYDSEDDMPKCETPGELHLHCVRTNSSGFDICDHYDTQETDPIGHDYKGTLVPAYCKCEETMLYICQNDPTHRYTEVTGNPELGHLFGNPYDLGNGYTRTECIREADYTNPESHHEECPYYVDTPNRYNIIYDLVLSTATYGANTPMYHTFGEDTTLVNPSASYYTFEGWFYDAEFTKPTNGVLPAKDHYAPVKLYAKWTGNTISLTLNAMKGTWPDGTTANKVLNHVYGTDTILPEPPSRTTHYFAGWDTDSDGDTAAEYTDVFHGTAVTSAEVLYAIWKANVFPIKYYDIDAGEFITMDTEYVTNTSWVSQLTYGSSSNQNITVPTRTGYTGKVYPTLELAQAGGSGNITQINRVNLTTDKYPEREVVLYVDWTPNTYTLTLNSMKGTSTPVAGGTGSTSNRTVSITYDTPYKICDYYTYSYTGYTFMGWDTASTAYNVVYAPDHQFQGNEFAAATTLYAVWAPQTITVSLAPNSGTLYNPDGTSAGTSAKSITHTWGTPTRISDFYTVKYSGRTLTGWKLSTDGTIITDGIIPADLIKTNGTSVTLTAQWVNNTFPIKYYDVMAEQFIDMDTDYVTNTSWVSSFTFGSSSTVNMTVPTRVGYTGTVYKTREAAESFTGNITGINRNTVTRANYPDEEIVFYVNWKPKTYTLTLDDMGGTSYPIGSTTGSGTNRTYTITYDTPYKISDMYTYAYTGYTFLGWDTASTGYNVVYGPDHQFRGNEFTANTTLYAVWAPDTMTITLDPNGGQLYAPDGSTPGSDKNGTITYTYGTGDVTIADFYNKLFLNTKTFTGWTIPTSSEKITDGIIPAKLLQDNAKTITLTAQWATNAFEVIYIDGDTGEVIGEDCDYILNPTGLLRSLAYGSSGSHTLVKPQRIGYTATFHKLADLSDTETKTVGKASITWNIYSEGKLTFYVKWTPDDTRVVFRLPNGDSVGAANLNAYFGIDNAWPMVDYGDTYILPENQRPGYHLAGFYSDTACTNRITYVKPEEFYTNYNQSTTYTDYNVYCKWEVEETTVPTGSVDLGVGATGVSSEFIGVDNIRYGIYAQSYPNVKIIGDKDSTNYVPPKVEYFLLEGGAYTWDEVVNVNEDRWISAENGVSFSLEGTPDGEYIMYVRLTDDQGNVNFISSQRFVIDNVAPVFDELEGGEYCFNKELEDDLNGYEFTVVEKYPDKITINGEAQSFVQLQLENDYTLTAGEDGADYVVYAKDKAGNETTVTVKIHNSHDWTDWYEENAETCLTEGNDRRDCQRCGKVETKVRPALGHDWKDTTYTFTADGKSCEAERICNRDASHVESETATVDNGQVTSIVTKAPTCTELGETTYTADFEADWAPETPTKTVADIDSLGHTEGEVVVENYIDATCLENGSYDNVVYCTVCNAELSRTPVTVPATDHKWGETSYAWADDHSSCTATIKCKNDESHTQSETVKAVKSEEQSVKPTCALEGKDVFIADFEADWAKTQTKEILLDRDPNAHPVDLLLPNGIPSVNTATCTEAGTETSYYMCMNCLNMNVTIVKDVPALGHNWKDATVTYDWIKDENGVWNKCVATRVCANNTEDSCTETSESDVTSVTVDATCTVDGSITYTAEFVEEGEDLDWTTTQTKVEIITAGGHTPGEPVRENLKKATCEKDGSYDEVVYCTVCKGEISRVEKSIPSPDWKHDYTTKCDECPWIVTKEPTFFEDGERIKYCHNRHVYDPAVFEDCGTFITEVIPKLNDDVKPVVSITEPDHDVTDNTIDYDKDGMNVTITASDANSGLASVTYTVEKDGKVIETVEAQIVDGKVNVEYPVNSNGEYVIKVTAVDKLDNKITVTTDKIVVDTDAPVLTPEAAESFDAIKVKVEDKYLDKVTVIADGTETVVTPDENGYITIPESTVETKSYTITATDKAGNSATVSVTAKYDGAAPVPTITTDLVNVNHNDGEADYTNDSDVVIIITAEDDENGAGVAHIDYVITDEEGNIVESGVYDENDKPVLKSEGKYVVSATATDKKGNTSESVSIDIIVVDYNSPVISSTTNADRSITVNVTDNFGVAKVTVNGAEAALDENGNYIIPANNTSEDKVYEIVATDRAGNVTDIVVITVPGDKTGPTLEAWDDENADLNDGIVDYDNDGSVEITIEATDTESGVTEITYVITDDEGNEISGTYDSENKPVITTDKDGEYTVVVTVKDNAGNVTEVTLDKIIVDLTDPVIVIPEWNTATDNTYCVPENNTITIDVIENNVESVVVKVNGVVDDQYTGKTLNLTGSEEGTTYEITVTDKVGNTTETAVVIYSVHAWDEGEVTTAATCLDTGIMTYTCTRCNATRTEVIPAAGHTDGEAVIENKVAPTCTEDGSYDVVVYCADCGIQLSRETVPVNKLGHTAGEAVVENNVAPTCTADGSYDTVVYCTVCGEELSRVTTTVEKLGHTAGEAVVENNVAPTCTADGSYDTVVYCTVCDAQISRETTVVSALGHTAGKAVVENNVAPTCTADGSYDTVVYCTVCGDELSRVTTTVEKLGHTAGEAVVENNVAPTCTADGSYDTVVYCTVCGEELSRVTTTVDKLDHDYEVTEHKDATCTEDGYDVYTCKNDANHTYTTVLTKLGHTAGEAVVENNVAPTCTADGSYDTVVYCTVCDTEISRVTTTVGKLGHSDDTYFAIVDGEPMKDNGDGTYTDGTYYEVEYCSRCDEELDRTEYTLHPVAQNVETGKLYADLQTALFEAAAGNTVKILEDLTVHDITALTSGYLDLNGHMLETYTLSTGMSTHFIDSSEGNKGHLVVEKEGQTINPSNCDFPVYVSFTAEDGTVKDGYRFFDTILLQQLAPKFTEDEKTGSKFVSVTFRPIIQDAATSKELLGDGGADNKIKIGLVFSVTDKNGVQSDIMHWICLDTLIETVYTNNRAIMVTLTGIEAYETITIGSVLISETLGVEMTTYEKDGKTYSTIGTYDIATGTVIEA
ncbi:MAG: InlB B-repeat-containing protein [Clostridia bacterium]|nr:InlB B-repeat-containing protein [Clostridia bacterium]